MNDNITTSNLFICYCFFKVTKQVIIYICMYVYIYVYIKHGHV